MATNREALSPPSVARPREWGGAALPATLLGFVFFLPAGTNYLTGLASHAPGTAVATAALLFGLFHRLRADRVLVIGFAIGVFVVCHLLFAATFGPIAYGKAGGSLFLLVLMLAAADCLGRWLFELPDDILSKAVAIIRWMMVAVGVVATFGIAPPGAEPWLKPVFPFTEPSHFALAFAPLLIEAVVRNEGFRRVAWLLLGFGLGYFLENLTLVLTTLVAAAVSIPLSRPLPWITAFVVTAVLFNLEYFAERVNFESFSSSAGTNLSVLIYIQGWDLVVDSFERTHGWGIGFQQLGLGYVNSPAAERIYRLVNIELNQQDGGLLAAKVISEFGIFGVLLIMTFTLAAIRCGLSLRKISARVRPASAGLTLALAFICAFTVNVFVRGLAYFDGTTLLFIAASFYLASVRRAVNAI